MHLPFPTYTCDTEFLDLVKIEAAARKIDLQMLGPFLPGGIAMATTAYKHLKSDASRVVIALYTALIIYVDDKFASNMMPVLEFNRRFCCGLPQLHPILESLAKILQEMSWHFEVVPSNLIVTSGLNLVTALLIETETQNMKVELFAQL